LDDHRCESELDGIARIQSEPKFQDERKGTMIVDRRTFTYKRGHQQEAIELLQQAKEMAQSTRPIRIYVSEIAPFDTIVTEIEFEDWEEYHEFWAEWSPGDAFWEKWYAATESGGSHEVWRLVP
jgi:hypothetical protein